MQDGSKMFGVWWFPECKDQRLPGELTYHSREPIELNIFWPHAPIEAAVRMVDDPTTKHSLLNGIVWDGSKQIPITLAHMLRETANFSWSVTSGHLLRERYVAYLLLQGINIDNFNDLALSTMSISFDELESWALQSFLGKLKIQTQTEYDGSQTPTPITLAQATVQLPLTHSSTSDQLTISVCVSNKEYFSRYVPYIEIHTESKISLDGWGEILYKTLQLFSMLVGDGIKGAQLTTNELNPYCPVQIYMQSLPSRETNGTDKAKVILPLSKIRHIFGKCLSNWAILLEKGQAAIDMYTVNLFRPSSLLQWKILSAYQGLEVLYRGRNPDQSKPGVRTILKDSVRVFREELPGLAEPLAPKEEEEQIINQLQAMRNYYTHYNPDLKEDLPKSPVEEMKLAYLLQLILEALLLLRITEDRDIVSDALKQSPRYHVAAYLRPL
jgi:hypothetical protein